MVGDSDGGRRRQLELMSPWALAGILVLLKILFFLFLLSAHPGAFYSQDTPTYILPARELVAYGTFSAGGNPELFRTPGYSLFLAPFVALFGTEGAHFAIPLQILIGAAMGLIAYRLVLELTGSALAARLGLLVTLIDPAVFVAELTLLTELLFAFMVVGGSWLLVRYVRTGRWPLLLAGVGLIGLSAYVRPVSIYLGYLLCLGLAVRGIRRRRLVLVAQALLALLFCVALLQVWVKRNEAHFGVRIFSSVQGASLYDYTAAAVQARATGESYLEVQRRFMETSQSPNPAVQAKLEEAMAKEILLAHPVATVKVLVKGLVTNLADPGLGILANMLELRRAQSGIIFKFYDMPLGEFVVYVLTKERALIVTMGLGALWIGCFWLAVLAGMRRRGWRLEAGEWVILLVAFYLLAVSAGPASTARFRVPAVPLLAVYAAMGVAGLLERGRGRGAGEAPGPVRAIGSDG